ncbi:MAG: hypothetical protein J0L80_10520 [Chitinophagales bacterium]|nr:hypothetical protein [Chitinophagales bacterium]
MKRLLLLLGLLPIGATAQMKSSDCQLDIYGCYVYSLKAFAKGSDGLAKFRKQILPAKTTDVYISKQYFTVNLPESAEGINYHYEDISEQTAELYKQQQSKKAICMYMTDLAIGADTCHLWMMPVNLVKQGNEIEMDYPSKGCKLNFVVNKETGKLCFANTVCPLAKKED